jgi:hypothetical protein
MRASRVPRVARRRAAVFSSPQPLPLQCSLSCVVGDKDAACTTSVWMATKLHNWCRQARPRRTICRKQVHCAGQTRSPQVDCASVCQGMPQSTAVVQTRALSTFSAHLQAQIILNPTQQDSASACLFWRWPWQEQLAWTVQSALCAALMGCVYTQSLRMAGAVASTVIMVICRTEVCVRLTTCLGSMTCTCRPSVHASQQRRHPKQSRRYSEQSVRFLGVIRGMTICCLHRCRRRHHHPSV